MSINKYVLMFMKELPAEEEEEEEEVCSLPRLITLGAAGGK